MDRMDQTRIQLPPAVTQPVQVFLNGVPLAEGDDFTILGRDLIIHRDLVKEGNLGFWRWFLGAWGVGTYRRNDVIDVRWTQGGRARILHDLDFGAGGD